MQQAFTKALCCATTNLYLCELCVLCECVVCVCRCECVMGVCVVSVCMNVGVGGRERVWMFVCDRVIVSILFTCLSV